MPIEELSLTIPAEMQGKRLDQALAELCPQHSRSRLQGWIKSGYITVNAMTPRQRDVVQGGETINIHAEIENPDRTWAREDIPLEIIHTDQDIIVLNKPPGLVVHPGAGNPEHTLLNALLYHTPELERIPRAGIVQRLDKDTSGLMIIARTLTAHTWLVDQIQNRQVTRQYQSIVSGVMTAGGTVEAPIGRHPIKRKRMAVVDNGKPARTHYRVIKRFQAHTFIQLNLESGRTHQIRVHMAHIRHPVTGDPVYGGRQRFPKSAGAPLLEALQKFPRQALHACRLELKHPASGETVSWEAPLPDDMTSLLTLLETNGN
ncbi:MAG: 23S rRNA pseudouridine(1911/1915/1917) synthase RluD [Gammaproteobacteria bacterium]